MPQYDEASKQELTKKIVHMHDDLGMGFRRLSKKLADEGWKVNKDSANRLYNEYKVSASAEVIEDKDLKHLKLTEARQRQSLKVEGEKEDIRRKLAILFVERNTMSFEKRKRLFTDLNMLLRFATRVMPTLYPMIWSEFTEYCETRGYDVAQALSIIVEEQRSYEVQPPQDENGKPRFDLYLRKNMREYLDSWLADEQKEADDEKKDHTQQQTNDEEETEIVTIDLPIETVTIELPDKEETEIVTIELPDEGYFVDII